MATQEEIDAQVTVDKASVDASQAKIDQDVAELATAKLKLQQDEAAVADPVITTEQAPVLTTEQIPAIPVETIPSILDKIETVVESGVADVVTEVKELVAKGKEIFGIGS